MLRLALPRCCAGARWARARRSWSGRRHQPLRQRERLAVQGRERQQAGQVRAATTARPCSASPAPVSPPSEHPHRRRARRGSGSRPSGPPGVADDLAAPVGQDDVELRRPGSGAAAASERSAGRAGRRSGSAARGSDRGSRSSRSSDGLARSDGVAGARARRAVGAAGRAASPWRWNRAPRSHSRRACQWISADRPLGHERVADEHPEQRPIGQRATREDEARGEHGAVVLRRSLIAIRGASASSRTWTA